MEQFMSKNLRGRKTRMVKQREAHLIMAIDDIDRCILNISTEVDMDKDTLLVLLKKLRKELCKI